MPKKSLINNISELPDSKPKTQKPQGDSMEAILSALKDFKNGDFSARLPEDTDNCDKRIISLINEIFELEEQSTLKIKDIRSAICIKGKSSERVSLSEKGQWREKAECINDILDLNTNIFLDIIKVIESAGRGDFSSKIELEAYGIKLQGDFLKLAKTVNNAIDKINLFTNELARVTKEVAEEGKLDLKVELKGIEGIWKTMADNKNLLISNLSSQLRDVSKVATAISKGELSQKITVDCKGEIQIIKENINSMMDNLKLFASELARVTREVGVDGRLGLKIELPNLEGAWKMMADNKNLLIANLTNQLRDVAKIATSIMKGDLSQKITVECRGEIQGIKETINIMMDNLRVFSSELARITKEVGIEGKLGLKIDLPNLEGAWKMMADNKNFLIANLTDQLRDVSKIAVAIARGDLKQRITVDVKGEILTIKENINSMMNSLQTLSNELARTAKEVGIDGKLGAEIEMLGLEGTWKIMAENQNTLIANLTDQLRDVSKVSTAIARGDLKQRIIVDVKGEILAIKENINSMMDRLQALSSELARTAKDVGSEGKLGVKVEMPGLEGTWKTMSDIQNTLISNLTDQLRDVSKVASSITKGDLNQRITVEVKGEILAIKENINSMIDTLSETTKHNQEQDWLKTNIAKFTRMLQGQRDIAVVAKSILNEITGVVGAQHGVFYVRDYQSKNVIFKLMASFAYRKRKNLSNEFKLGEGLVGECAIEKQRILITDVPDDYVEINSGLGKAAPRNIVVLPVLFEGEVKSIIELASFQQFTDIKLTFLDQLAESIGIVIASIEANMKTEELLQQTQQQAEELQTQQEELRTSNEELENKTQTLQASEEKLKAQQEELQATNEELEEKTNSLEQQKTEITKKNMDLDNVRIALEAKAEELAVSSKYKSEFLANMSHELRTPLNSLLILSKNLSDNKKGNLDEKQIEAAKIVHKSGQDLLNLINEILDLSKIEAGKMTVKIEKFALDEFKSILLNSFKHVAEQKNLDFSIIIEKGTPPEIWTDCQRIEQVANNLISNALKFTSKGSVSVRFFRPDDKTDLSRSRLNCQEAIAFSVKDTGIGIPKDKHLDIFEAFQQADGSTSRKFGGTGLGLSISRELIRVLGGEIHLESEEGVGATFTVYLPIQSSDPNKPSNEDHKRAHIEEKKSYVAKEYSGKAQPFLKEEPGKNNKNQGKTTSEQIVKDDRDNLAKDDRFILIIEDDINFAQILRQRCNERGFKALIATEGESGVEAAVSYKPEAIILDLMLPGMDGWEVIEALKSNTAVRHIPVHIVSCLDPDSDALRKGAIGYAQKPLSEDSIKSIFKKFETVINRPVKKVLLIEDDKSLRMAIKKVLSEDDIDIIEAPTGKTGLEIVSGDTVVDCIILDIGLPDINGLDLLKEMNKLKKAIPPVVVYTGKDIEPDELKELNKYTESVIIKGIKSEDRLIDEVSLFLHQVVNNMPDKKRKMIIDLHESDNVFKNKKVLIVDDDVRNIFALSGLFEERGMTVLDAENGKEALEKIESEPRIDIVLMDIMMPVMDGYEAIKEIRKNNKWSKLPIIAVTAKAMPEDKAKCIEAGANDYLAKPVKEDKLFSMLRVWLYKQEQRRAQSVEQIGVAQKNFRFKK